MGCYLFFPRLHGGWCAHPGLGYSELYTYKSISRMSGGPRVRRQRQGVGRVLACLLWEH